MPTDRESGQYSARAPHAFRLVAAVSIPVVFLTLTLGHFAPKSDAEENGYDVQMDFLYVLGWTLTWLRIGSTSFDNPSRRYTKYVTKRLPILDSDGRRDI